MWIMGQISRVPSSSLALLLLSVLPASPCILLHLTRVPCPTPFLIPMLILLHQTTTLTVPSCREKAQPWLLIEVLVPTLPPAPFLRQNFPASEPLVRGQSSYSHDWKVEVQCVTCGGVKVHSVTGGRLKFRCHSWRVEVVHQEVPFHGAYVDKQGLLSGRVNAFEMMDLCLIRIRTV